MTGSRNTVNRKRRLPIAPDNYDPRYMNELVRAIEKAFDERESVLLVDIIEAREYRDRVTSQSGGITKTLDDELVCIWGLNAVRGEMPRTNVMNAVSGDTITLAANNDAREFFYAAETGQQQMEGNCYVRVWNTSKSPDESAWVKAVPDKATNDRQLQVTDADDISTWASGETLQIGEVTSGFNNTVAIDISPLLIRLFGRTFRHEGLFLRGVIEGGATDNYGILCYPELVAGKGQRAVNSNTANKRGYGSLYLAGRDLSPISTSNLVYVREDFNGASDGAETSLYIDGLVFGGQDEQDN